MVFIANHQPPEIIHPSKQTLNFPAAAIAAKLPAILCRWLLSPLPMWRNQLNTSLLRKLLVKPIAIICFVDSKTPFFVDTKVPSIKASRISISPRSYRSCASSWAISRNTPCRTNCWKRLWHVWYGGYLDGKSFQGAPVRNIHNIPSRTWRGSRAGRPRGSLDGADARIMGSIRFHCSFASSFLII